MKILVYDIAATAGGAVTILDSYYRKALNDTENEWYFIVSIDRYKTQDNVRVIFEERLSCQGITRWIRRLDYDWFKVKKIISDIRPDHIISLQNIPISGCNAFQTVYLHQPLQFSPIKYSFFKAQERHFAVRQRIICNIIKRRLKDADEVIVQTQWMKKAVVNWAKYPPEQIHVEFPTIQIPQEKDIAVPDYSTFFYPASEALHKNHGVIIDACLKLKEKGINEYKVIFTLTATENAYTRRIFDKVFTNSLPIEFIGFQNQEAIYEKYRNSVLVFPSYLETFGLPLLEARSVGSTIIASDLSFSHEILDDYPKATFVAWDDATMWCKAMLCSIEKQHRLKEEDL